MLLVAPYARRPVTLAAERLGAAAYVDLTAAVMRASAPPSSRPARPPGGSRLSPALPGDRPGVEYDASAAAHLFALAAATGGRGHGDQRHPAPAARRRPAGAAGGDGRHRDPRRRPPDRPRAPRACPVDADLAAMPDQVTTVAALAALAAGRPASAGSRSPAATRPTAWPPWPPSWQARRGRHRAARRAGHRCAGPDRLRPARLATWGDHRMAMALAAVAARVPGVVLEDPGCVAKTYPGFWRDLAAAGWRRGPIPAR